jgi:copper transport protein
MKKHIITSISLVLLALPGLVSAHALPVSTAPASSEILDTQPALVSMTFSEHVDPSASSIRVTDASGTLVSEIPKIDPADAHTLSVSLKPSGDGTYLVSWSVVSADDGHFTRGAYPFAVGKNSVIQSSASSQDVEIVEITTTPEAFASAVELFGHGLLWAILLLFAFGMRPLITTGRFDAESTSLRRIYIWCVGLGSVFALAGGAAQLLVKSTQLAGLQSLTFHTALTTYIGTAAGESTLYRMIAILAFLVVFFVGKRAIARAQKITAYEILLIAILMVFAFMRAKISHATSNPFHPDFSILINFFHVIEKDIWAGILAILLVLATSKRMRRFLDQLIPAAFGMLAIDFGAVSVTAAYIVWLHLKSFGNIFTTQWGGAFLELLLMAILLVAMRVYHVLARAYRPRLFSRMLPASLAAEFAFALLVVYCSSVVIITSPPIAQPPVKTFVAHDQGISISLSPDQYDAGQLLLTDVGAGGIDEPVVTVQDTARADDPVSIGLSQTFDGGYVFPKTLLSGTGPFTVSITVPQSNRYDAHATFVIENNDLVVAHDWQLHREFDMFTGIMIVIALLALCVGIVLYRFSRVEAVVASPPPRQIPGFTAGLAFVPALFAAAVVLTSFHGSVLENPFAAHCIADGNEWHIMLPSMAGVPTSQVPAEGCMWGMGNYMYMFPDQREYDYYKDLGVATASLTPQTFTAGIPATITASLKNVDGTPATLFMDMEKIMHMVIISSDESVFAHIHADDLHPIPQQDLVNSTFTFDYTFPKAGEYLIAVDYAHGTALESKQFKVHVNGAPGQSTRIVQYPTRGTFDGYDVSLDYAQPQVGEITTIKYAITKNGKPVQLMPYLSAAMHVAVVKNDFSWYLHVHGEYHVPGAPLAPLSIKNGQVLHTMAMMATPQNFTSPIEAHMIFPSPGVYTVWGQFKTAPGELVATAFTVRVE